MSTLGKRISDYRKEKKLKQEELAEMLNVSPQAVSKWENDLTCPDISTLPIIANIFNVTIDELLVGKKENTQIVEMLPEEKIKDISKLMLRIVIQSIDGDKVKVNLPMPIIEAAINLGLDMPEISGNVNLKNVDIKKIFELVQKGVVGNLIEIESADGDTINIFVE